MGLQKGNIQREEADSVARAGEPARLPGAPPVGVGLAVAGGSWVSAGSCGEMACAGVGWEVVTGRDVGPVGKARKAHKM
jgi:hypothetical protein